MLRFPRMTVTSRIRIGFTWTAVLVLMLVATVVAQTLWLQSWRDDYRQSLARANTANNIQVKIFDTAIFGLDIGGLETATQTELEVLKKRVDSNLEDINGYLNSLEASATLETASAVANIKEYALQYMQGFQEAVTLAENDASAVQGKVNEIQRVLILLQDSLNGFSRAEKATGDDLLQSHDSTSQIVMIVAIVLAALATSAGVGGAWLISRIIDRQLRGAFTKLSTSASELMAVSTQVAGNAAQTAASTAEATATVEEVKQTAALASEKAEEVGRESQDLPRVADAGRAAAEETAVAFEHMRGEMLSVVDAISQLSERAQAVEEIIATVNDLAEQSNLLSVNASIEAAKAGEYGKGFNVVAQEVKSLAGQSKTAVVQARSVLGEIVKAGDLAIQSAGAGQESVDAGLRQSEESGKSIFALAESASRSAESATQISVSSRQQLSGMEQIAQVIDQINQASEQSAAGTRQVQQEVVLLQELASELRGLVDRKAWTDEASMASPELG